MNRTRIMPIFAVALMLFGCQTGGDASSSGQAPSSEEESENSSSSSSVHVHDYRATATEPSCTEDGYTTYTCACGESYVGDHVSALGHDFVDGVCTACGDALSNGDLYRFGSYPQECVEDEALISVLSSIEEDDDSYVEHGGNRYFKTPGSLSGSYSEEDFYFFESRPLTWRYYDGLLISEKIIDASVYFPEVAKLRGNDDAYIYSTNYELSTVRAYLNGYDGRSYSVDDFSSKGFIDKAFTAEELNRIKTTTVDNSAPDRDSETNQYACPDTDDRIFLLSYLDANNADYGFSEETMLRKYTDFAVYSGLEYHSASTGAGNWWLRTPYSFLSGDVWEVTSYGSITQGSTDVCNGLVPALNLK